MEKVRQTFDVRAFARFRSIWSGKFRHVSTIIDDSISERFDLNFQNNFVFYEHSALFNESFSPILISHFQFKPIEESNTIYDNCFGDRWRNIQKPIICSTVLTRNTFQRCLKTGQRSSAVIRTINQAQHETRIRKAGMYLILNGIRLAKLFNDRIICLFTIQNL